MNLNKLIIRGIAALALTLVVIGLCTGVSSDASAQAGASSSRIFAGSSACQSDGVTLTVSLPSDMPGFVSTFNLTVEGTPYGTDELMYGQSATITVALPGRTSYSETYAEGWQTLTGDDNEDMVGYLVLYPACEMTPVTTTTTTSVLAETTTTTTTALPDTTTSTISVETTTTVPVTTTTSPAVLIPSETTSSVPEPTATSAVEVDSGINQERSSSDQGELAVTGGTVPGLPYFAAGLFCLGVALMVLRRTPAH